MAEDAKTDKKEEKKDIDRNKSEEAVEDVREDEGGYGNNGTEEGSEDYSDEVSEKIKDLQQGPHFDFVDSLFYLSMAILSDLLDGTWIARFFFAPATLMWLYLKGVDAAISKNAIAQGIELIPAVGFLPISTIAAILTIWATNNPESFGKFFGIVGKMMKKFGKGKK